MQIVRAKEGDVKDISRCRRDFIRRFNSRDYSLENLDVLLVNSRINEIHKEIQDSDVFCMTKNGKVFGVVSLDGNQISGIYVDCDFLNQGYEQKLLEFIENYAKSKGYEKVYVYSTISDKKFYAHNGYSFEGIAVGVESDSQALFFLMEKHFNNN